MFLWQLFSVKYICLFCPSERVSGGIRPRLWHSIRNSSLWILLKAGGAPSNPRFQTGKEWIDYYVLNVCSTFIWMRLFLLSQTASWISAAPAVLEEYMQCVSNGEDLKFLLQSKQCHGKLAKSSVGMFAQIQPIQQFSQ